MRRRFQTKIYASGKEEELLADPQKNVSVMMGDNVSLKADVWLDDGQELELLGETMRCILTPGHTSGGMCFYFRMHACCSPGIRCFRSPLEERTFRPAVTGH